MHDSVVINYYFKTSVQKQEKNKEQCSDVFLSYFPTLSTLGNLEWEKKYIFDLYFPMFCKSIKEWIAILLFQ